MAAVLRAPGMDIPSPCRAHGIETDYQGHDGARAEADPDESLADWDYRVAPFPSLHNACSVAKGADRTLLEPAAIFVPRDGIAGLVWTDGPARRGWRWWPCPIELTFSSGHRRGPLHNESWSR